MNLTEVNIYPQFYTDNISLVRERLLEYQDVFDILPVNTKKAYLVDMRKFFSWCEVKEFTLNNDLAHNKKVLKAFFRYLLAGELSRSAITRCKSSLSKFISITLLPNPFSDEIFKSWVSLSIKKKSAKKKQAVALTDTLLLQINNQLDETCIIQLRDKVLLNIMFDCLLRSSELSALMLVDINFRQESLFISKSKTDQDGKGQLRALSHYTLALIKKWTSVAGITDGYLLRNLTGLKRVTAKPLGYDGVSNTFTRFTRLVDIYTDTFTTHSARVGAAVTMAEHNCTTLDIQLAGGWKSASMPLRYTEQVDIHRQGMGSIMNKINR